MIARQNFKRLWLYSAIDIFCHIQLHAITTELNLCIISSRNAAIHTDGLLTMNEDLFTVK